MGKIILTKSLFLVLGKRVPKWAQNESLFKFYSKLKYDKYDKYDIEV